jgi:hypothetical protein
MFRTSIAACALGLALLVCPRFAVAQYSNFAEAGTAVAGYQDDFAGAALAPGWVEYDGGNDDAAPLFAVSGGVLVMNPAAGDPNKLLYNPAGTTYSATAQNVLALVRVRTAGSGDGFRGGVAASSSAANSQGFNLHFRNADPASAHFRLLDDALAWGPRTSDTVGGDTWQAGQWKWLRLVTSGTTVQGKVWDAGTAAEPAGFDLAWTRGGRSGLAGLVTNSIGGQGTLEVDYVLIQAQGLPQITVAPEPASLGLLALASLATLRRRRIRA